MANRYVAFGYEITEGKLTIIESERQIVVNIFAMYLNGKSLLEISDRVNASGVSYNNDGRTWDKHMIKRILENRKYIGEYEYPVMIPKETFEQAANRKAGKYTRLNKQQLEMFRLLHERMTCGLCGSILIRYKGGGRPSKQDYWNCSNPDCNMTGVNEKKVHSGIINALNYLIENYESIDQEIKNETKNEICRQERHRQYDRYAEMQDLVNDICAEAQARFLSCQEMDYGAINRHLKQVLSIQPKQKQLDVRLLSAVAKKIRLYAAGSVELELPNGYTAKGDAGC